MPTSRLQTHVPDREIELAASLIACVIAAFMSAVPLARGRLRAERQAAEAAQGLSDPSATVIVVEHRDRLARFGVEHLDAALAAQGRRVLAADPARPPMTWYGT